MGENAVSTKSNPPRRKFLAGAALGTGVAAGFPMIIAVSAPTAAAVGMADEAGITLIALARPDGFEIFTHPHRIAVEEAAHVA